MPSQFSTQPHHAVEKFIHDHEEKGISVKALVTGGAGFIGTHRVSRLLAEGCRVAVLDHFSAQVHGSEQELPADPHRRCNHALLGLARNKALVTRFGRTDMQIQIAIVQLSKE